VNGKSAFFFFVAMGTAVFVGLTFGKVSLGVTIEFSLASLITGQMACAYAISETIAGQEKP
jgi:hypothetical protein